MKHIDISTNKHPNAQTIVDNMDFEILSKWRWRAVDSRGIRYAARTGKKKNIFMHRFLMKTKGVMHTDHINGNSLDNRRKNLRVCSASQNQANSLSKTGTSKYKGVSFYKKLKRWVAEIKLNYKTIYIGSFKDEDDAAAAYNKKAKELFGHFARLNIIGEEL